MDNILVKGILPALITPFYDNGKVKVDTVRQLVDWHLSEEEFLEKRLAWAKNSIKDIKRIEQRYFENLKSSK